MSDDTDRRDLDLRTDDQAQADDELDDLLAAYERRKQADDLDPDDPLDEKLRELHEQTTAADADTQMTDDTTPDTDTDTDATDTDTDTGPTTVALADEPTDDFDPDADPDPAAVEDAAPSVEQKAKRRAELQADGHLTDDTDDTDDTAAADEADAQPDDEDAGGRYGVDISAGEKAADEAAGGADADVSAPQTEYDPDAEPDDIQPEPFSMDSSEMPDYDEVAEAMGLEELDPADVDMGAIEDQDLEDPNETPGERAVRLPLGEGKTIDIVLAEVTDDGQLNVLDQMQATETLGERITVAVDTAVKAPRGVVEAQTDWSLGNRMKLFNECQRQLGLDSLTDFR